MFKDRLHTASFPDYRIARSEALVQCLLYQFPPNIKLAITSGRCGAEKEVQKEAGSCYKKFRTRAQAEAFIEAYRYKS
jgi:hypothetical protein